MFVAPFAELPADATPLAGGKGASLARMTGAGLPVPPGFVICAPAFESFLESGGAAGAILGSLRHCNASDPPSLDAAAQAIHELIVSVPLPAGIEQQIRDALRSMLRSAVVAVRSSAVCEDDASASYAGQQETFLNVSGGDEVVKAVKDCWASFFSPRALFYRSCKGRLDDLRMAVVVQEMVDADRSGVMFTVDPIQNRHDRIMIEAAFGLGERIVSGETTPDHYVVDKDDGTIANEVIQDDGRPVLSVDDLSRLREFGLTLERFFGCPQDVEWCMKGAAVFLLQSRPITTLSHAR